LAGRHECPVVQPLDAAQADCIVARGHGHGRGPKSLDQAAVMTIAAKWTGAGGPWSGSGRQTAGATGAGSVSKADLPGAEEVAGERYGAGASWQDWTTCADPWTGGAEGLWPVGASGPLFGPCSDPWIGDGGDVGASQMAAAATAACLGVCTSSC
jgi:hypothetical protein